ncbi:MAG: hypothetical protein IKG72_13060 [Bacillus sp. (in: Bacteria)]|nr:hypothetical protein [Parasporobacterium sp.]MBR3381012.1 hypothetical protein [Bacillus sp. (in: firmicutes)]
MTELYYSGIDLEKDLLMCRIYDALEANNDVIILRHGRDALIHEVEATGRWGENRKDTGRTHLGFDFHFITIFYKGTVFNIEPAQYYPFIDDNYPGMINFIAFETDGWHKTQESYFEEYKGIQSLNAYLENKPIYRPLKDHVPTNSQPFHKQKGEFEKILEKEGGFREKAIYNSAHICYDVMDTKDHKVVRCARAERDADGVRESFDIDLVSQKIVN